MTTTTARRVQSREALALANHIRLARCAAKRQVANREITVGEILDSIPGELQGMSIGDLVRSVPRYGKKRARLVLWRLAITEARALRELTARQKSAICEELEGRR